MCLAGLATSPSHSRLCSGSLGSWYSLWQPLPGLVSTDEQAIAVRFRRQYTRRTELSSEDAARKAKPTPECSKTNDASEHICKRKRIQRMEPLRDMRINTFGLPIAGCSRLLNRCQTKSPAGTAGIAACKRWRSDAGQLRPGIGGGSQDAASRNEPQATRSS